MSLDVFIYNSSMYPLKSTRVEILENDDTGVKLDVQTSGPMSGRDYGASLRSHNCPVIVWLDDRSGAYAATDLGYLNGKRTTRLDVTLYPLPAPKHSGGGPGGGGGGGRGPGDRGGSPRFGSSKKGQFNLDEPQKTPAQIVEYIQEQVKAGNWTTEEGTGVSTLVATVTRAMQLIQQDKAFSERLARWLNTLKALGIMIRQGDDGGEKGPGNERLGMPTHPLNVLTH
ncbi:MAG TPA: hypothetical protein VNS58_09185 [Puia sp.]|nr:hypothetical protein [Puia sp.]